MLLPKCGTFHVHAPTASVEKKEPTLDLLVSPLDSPFPDALPASSRSSYLKSDRVSKTMTGGEVGTSRRVLQYTHL